MNLVLLLPVVLLAGLAVTPPPLGFLARNTLALYLASLIIALPLSLLAAVVLTRLPVAGRLFAWMLLGSLLLVPLYVQVAAWEAGFGQQGWLTRHLGRSFTAPLVAGLRGAAWIHAMAAIPWMTGILAVALRKVPREIEEMSLLDADWRRVVLQVTLPQVVTAIGIAGLWLLATVVSDITVADCYLIRTLAEELYTGFALAEDLGALQRRLVPAGLLLAGAAVAIAVATVLAQRLPRWTTVARGLQFPAARRWPHSFVLWSIIALIAGVPLSNLIFQAGLEVRPSPSGTVRDWSLSKLLVMLSRSPHEFSDELIFSGALALLVAAGSLAIASPLAWWSQGNSRRLGVTVAAMAMGLAIPAPVLALGVISLLNDPRLPWLNVLYDRTPFPIWSVHVVKAVPVTFLLLWVAMRSIPRELMELARLEGWPARQRYWQLGVCLTLPAHGVGWLVAAALSVGELTATILVSPAGFSTVSVRVFGLVHYGVQDQLAALCLVVWGGALFFAALAGIFLSSWAAHGRRIISAEPDRAEAGRPEHGE